MIHILLNKDRYIEFEVSHHDNPRLLRLLFGPGIKTMSSTFYGSKTQLPRVKKVLDIKKIEYKVTEDWI